MQHAAVNASAATDTEALSQGNHNRAGLQP